MGIDQAGLPDHQTRQVGPPDAPTSDQVHTHPTDHGRPPRPPQTVRVEDLFPITKVLLSGGQGWPWQQVGVFPTKDDSIPWDWFNYTVGLGSIELVTSCVSIEGRAAPNDLVAEFLNVIAAGWTAGRVTFGDSIIIPIGIPNDQGEWDRDEDSIWWLANEPALAEDHAVNMSTALLCCPIKWSSPQGWDDE